MEKLSEISLGRKGLFVKFGSLLIIVLIGGILFFGIFKITMPVYTEVEIVANEGNVFLISNTQLNSVEKIKLETGHLITVDLKKLDSEKYKIFTADLSDTILQNLKSKTLTNGKILLKEENLFESLLPFW